MEKHIKYYKEVQKEEEVWEFIEKHIQYYKEVQKEEEVWEFMEKRIVLVLTVTSATITDREGAKSRSDAPNADLHAYLTGFF